MNMIRPLQGIILSVALVGGLAQAASTIVPAPPSITGDSYLLMDFKTGKILVEDDIDKRVEPASLTKMMTSYIASREIEDGNIQLDDKVTVSKNAWASNPRFKGSSLMFIEVGNQVNFEDLLRGVIIQSGNDASVAIAEHIAGSEDSFADLMNAHAERLGMTGSNFVNSTGLPDDDHYTTARDMALLAYALIADTPDEYAMYEEKEFTFNKIRQFNRNELLWDKSLNVDGIKTGHTEAAGYCLVTSAEKDGMRLISVVMGSSSAQARKADTKKLLTYGFRFFETIKPTQAGQELVKQRIWMGDQDEVALGAAEDIWVTIPRGQKGKLKANWELNQDLEAPLEKGAQVGTISYQIEGETLAEYPLVALESIEQGGMISRAMDWVVLFVKGMLN